MEGDAPTVVLWYIALLFLSTPSGWRATAGRKRNGVADRDFYPRPPGGGRPRAASFRPCLPVFLSTPSGWRATYLPYYHLTFKQFLSTPSGWRATRQKPRTVCKKSIFLSTPSGWRATTGIITGACDLIISIHALRVEGDLCQRRKYIQRPHFYPRPPGGGRHCIYFTGYSDK